MSGSQAHVIIRSGATARYNRCSIQGCGSGCGERAGWSVTRGSGACSRTANRDHREVCLVVQAPREPGVPPPTSVCVPLLPEKERRFCEMPEIIGKRFVESAIKRILFVEPQSGYSTGFNDTVRVETLGPEYLAGAVQDVAECRLVDLRTSRADLLATMDEFQPQLIALKCGYTTDVPVVADLARQIKATDPQIPIVVGGHHISLSPQDLFTPEIDGIAYGEAEDIFPLIVRELGAGRSLERVPYVYYRKPDGDFGTTVIPQPVVNTILHDSHEMNARPMPQRSLCDPYRDEYYFLYHQQPYSVETS